MALGAAVGEAVLGRRIGRRAALYGAVLGTLPDLDVLIPLGDPVADFTEHRGFSHSLFVLTLASPVVALLIQRLPAMRRAALDFRSAWALAFGALITHPLLDAFTVYGTQLFWPLTSPPVSGSAIFIIDPLFTVPLLLGLLLTALAYRRASALAADPGTERSTADARAIRAARPNLVGLGVACAYLVWALVAKQLVATDVERALARRGLSDAPWLSTPGPFTTLLWRIVVMDGDRYLEGYTSLVDGSDAVAFTAWPTEPDLLDDLAEDWRVARLRWFTHGFHSVRRDADDVLLTDLRMGAEPSYIFSFRLGRLAPDGSVRPAVTEQRSQPFDLVRLRELLERVTTPPRAVP